MSRDFLPVLELYGNGLDWGRNKINLLVFHLIVFPWGRARLVTPGRHNVQDMRWNSRTTPTSTFKYRNKDRNRYKYRKNTDFADRSRETQCTRHEMEFQDSIVVNRTLALRGFSSRWYSKKHVAFVSFQEACSFRICPGLSACSYMKSK